MHPKIATKPLKYLFDYSRGSTPEKGKKFNDSGSSTPTFMFEYTNPSLQGEVYSIMVMGVLELNLHFALCRQVLWSRACEAEYLAYLLQTVVANKSF